MNSWSGAWWHALLQPAAEEKMITGGSLGGEEDCGPGLVVEELEPLRHGAQLPLDALARHTPHFATRSLEINVYFIHIFLFIYMIILYIQKIIK